MKILVTNIGRRVYFVKFLLELKKYFKNLKIFLTDNNLEISALKIKGVNRIRTPKVEKGKNKYLNNLFQIVKKNKISLLIPCTNYDLKILSFNKNKFNIHVYIINIFTICLCDIYQRDFTSHCMKITFHLNLFSIYRISNPHPRHYVTQQSFHYSET